MSTNNETSPTPRTVNASEFNEKCLDLVDEVAECGAEVVIIRDGKPVAKLSPYAPAAMPAAIQQEKPKSLFGLHRGQYEIIGDIDDVPLFVEWDADAWQPVADPRILKGKPDWLSGYDKDGQDFNKEPGMSTDNETSQIPRTVKVAEFQENCLELVVEVAESGAEIIITKDGKPVAKLSPHRNAAKPTQGDPGLYFGRMRGKIQVYGDIVAPMPAEWFAVPDDDDTEEQS